MLDYDQSYVVVDIINQSDNKFYTSHIAVVNVM